MGFDLQGFIDQAGGYLSTYSERVDGETLTGAQIVRFADGSVRVIESSVPRDAAGRTP